MRTRSSYNKQVGCAGIAIAIILILFVLPYVFDQFIAAQKVNARSATCESNERAIGLALEQYAQDNDDQFPAGRHATGVGWAGPLHIYAKYVAPFHCPDDPTLPTTSSEYPTSYAINNNLSRDRTVLSDLAGANKTVAVFEVSGVIARIDLPDEGANKGAKRFSAAGDGIDGSLISGDAPARYATGLLGKRPALPTGSQVDSPTGRHAGRSNILFADGHVEPLAPDQVSSGTDALSPADAQTGTAAGRAAGTQSSAFAATFSTR